jgi:hypothetical protein
MIAVSCFLLTIPFCMVLAAAAAAAQNCSGANILDVYNQDCRTSIFFGQIWDQTRGWQTIDKVLLFDVEC